MHDDYDIPDSEFELDPEAAHLPVLDVTELVFEDHLQDDIDEGLGGKFHRAFRRVFPKAPRGWKAAIKDAVRKVENGKWVEAGYCLRETRTYFGVDSRYAAAVDSMRSAGRKGKLHNLRGGKAPRGSIVYLAGGGSKYGHVMLSVGGGFAISTDWPRNRYGRCKIENLRRAWGYTEVKWSPLVNDVRVWPRKDLYGKKKKIKKVVK